MPLEVGLNFGRRLIHKRFELQTLLNGYLAVDFLSRVGIFDDCYTQGSVGPSLCKVKARIAYYQEEANSLLKYDLKLK